MQFTERVVDIFEGYSYIYTMSSTMDFLGFPLPSCFLFSSRRLYIEDQPGITVINSHI